MSATNQSVAMLPAVSLHPNSTSDLNAITNQFYNENPHLEDGRLKAHRIEFEVTLRMILSLIAEGTTARILDIGGGAGTSTNPHRILATHRTPLLYSLHHRSLFIRSCRKRTLRNACRSLIWTYLPRQVSC